MRIFGPPKKTRVKEQKAKEYAKQAAKAKAKKASVPTRYRIKQAGRALRSCVNAVINAALAPVYVASVFFDKKDLNDNPTSFFGHESNSAAQSNAVQQDITVSSTPPVVKVGDRSPSTPQSTSPSSSSSSSSSSSISISSSTKFGSFSPPSSRSSSSSRSTSNSTSTSRSARSTSEVDTLGPLTREVEQMVEQAQSEQTTLADVWKKLNPDKKVDPTFSKSSRSSSRRNSSSSSNRTPSPPGILQSASPDSRSPKSSSSPKSVTFGENENRTFRSPPSDLPPHRKRTNR